ncbi:hypothetical protein XaC1_44 [Xanthomonas phage XaC1]|nr:hypothetical protein XaC1_44 [Xanthomonas phage XaC1]
MSTIHQYAIVDEETDLVIGKYVSTQAPAKMRNIPYAIMDINDVKSTGKAFLSRSVKYWDQVKHPLYNYFKDDSVVLL